MQTWHGWNSIWCLEFSQCSGVPWWYSSCISPLHHHPFFQQAGSSSSQRKNKLLLWDKCLPLLCSGLCSPLYLSTLHLTIGIICLCTQTSLLYCKQPQERRWLLITLLNNTHTIVIAEYTELFYVGREKSGTHICTHWEEGIVLVASLPY